jgi:hypothetical protein
MKSTVLAAMTVSVSITSSGISGATIVFSNSYPYDHGNYPSAAQGLNTWADAHQGSGDELWYHVSGEGGYNYDHGYFPTIATDTLGNYIEIHQADSVASPFWFKIGWDNGSGSQYMLNSAKQNDSGMSPVIAVHGHPCLKGGTTENPDPDPLLGFAHIVQVHQGGTGTGYLWMNVGMATDIDCNGGGDAFGKGGACSQNNCTGTTQWGGVQWFGAQPYDYGFYPSVAVNSVDSGHACILEVHQVSGPGYSTIRYSSGVLGVDPESSSWSYTQTSAGPLTPLEIGSNPAPIFGPNAGQHPTTCIYDGHNGGNSWDTGVVVMEYEGQQLWECDGPIGVDAGRSGQDCVWGAAGQGIHCSKYDVGFYPRVSCESGLANGNGGGVQGVEVHQGTNSTSDTPLWVRTFTEQ